jgi:N-glycosylase/DNA lyase
MGDAINTLKTILRVRDDKDIRRMDNRGRDFYKGFRRYPHLHQAVRDLRDAHKYLESSNNTFGGLKERALRDVRRATEELEAGLREGERR